MNRREFLEAAALAAALPTGIRAANDKVNVAIIGLGGRGQAHMTEYQVARSPYRCRMRYQPGGSGTRAGTRSRKKRR